MLERVNEVTAGLLGFGVIFTPELLELLTAVVVVLNTILITRHTRKVERDIRPQVDHIHELAEDAVVTAAEVKSNLDAKDRADRRKTGRGGRRGSDQ